MADLTSDPSPIGVPPPLQEPGNAQPKQLGNGLGWAEA